MGITKMNEKKCDELNVGYFGLREDTVKQLEQIFKTVERVKKAEPKDYDLLIFDISYARYGMFSYMKSLFPIPILLISECEDSLQRIPGYIMAASFLMESTEEFSKSDFAQMVLLYIRDFEDKRFLYEGLKSLDESREKMLGEADDVESVQKQFQAVLNQTSQILHSIFENVDSNT